MKKNQSILVLVATTLLIGLLAFTTIVGFGQVREQAQPEISKPVWSCPEE